jgi:hypothetical protein
MRASPHVTQVCSHVALVTLSVLCARGTYGEEDGGECYERRRDWCVNVAVSKRSPRFI